MLGAIAGDVLGSIYEGKHSHIKTTDFQLFNDRCHFTDDTVMNIAIADAILDKQFADIGYLNMALLWGARYPHAGWGRAFKRFLFENPQPYHSWGNGAAMRSVPVGWACNTVSDVLREAATTAVFSHNHPEGIKGAQAVALAVFLARKGLDKEAIRQELHDIFDYDLGRTIAQIRPTYTFQVSCQLSVPEALIAFLDATDYESAVRNAISLGGDADTQACIAGGIAEAFYGGVPEEIAQFVKARLPDEFLNVINQFYVSYVTPGRGIVPYIQH